MSGDVEYRVILSANPEAPDYRRVTEQTFEAYLRCARGLRTLELIEEAYDVVIGNFTAFEEVVLRHSIQHLANRYPWGRSDHFDVARRDCHRALANLLSSARAFIDLSSAQISAWSDGRTDDLQRLKTAFSEQYDSRFGFRVMEALRNHAQHHGLSVTGVGFQHGIMASDDAGETRTRIQAVPCVHMDELRENPRFKKTVLAELERRVERKERSEFEDFPVLPFVRDYVAGLSVVLEHVREQFGPREQEWSVEIRWAYQFYFDDARPPEPHGFTMEAWRGSRLLAEHWIGSNIFRRLAALRDVNGPLPYITRQVVTQ